MKGKNYHEYMNSNHLWFEQVAQNIYVKSSHKEMIPHTECLLYQFNKREQENIWIMKFKTLISIFV
jgi:hypothetical protein